MLKRLILFTLVILSFQAVGKDAYTSYGDVAQIAIPTLGGAYSFSLSDYEGMKLLAIDVALIMGAVHGIKYIVNTRRPHGGSHSFPSGHSAAAFSGGAYMHRRYGFLYGLPLYIAAGLVGHSRVRAKAHWPIDVFGAALVAYGVSHLLIKKYIPKKLDMMVLPTTNGLQVGASYKIS